MANSLTGRLPPIAISSCDDIIECKVHGLLSILTTERFESISNQIITLVNKSENEKDGRMLIQVIRLILEKATNDAVQSEIYARLCRKMMEQISANIQDDGIKNSGGKPVAGGLLFRKYLVGHCEVNFERWWVAKEATAAADAMKATEDQTTKATAEETKDGESALYSDKYYAAQKAKRQGFGLIKFVGELFKFRIITERIMHECVNKLLENVEHPKEEEIESLCTLLTTVGQIIDTPKARTHMDVYFSRMKEMCKSPNVNPGMQSMLQDVIELRERKWVIRNQVAAPTTIAARHQTAAKATAVNEKDIYQYSLSMFRGDLRRGGERVEHAHTRPDRWATTGSSAPRPSPKTDDHSYFSRLRKAASMTFDPSSILAGKETKRDYRGSMKMFSMLRQNPEVAVESAASSKSSRPPKRKASIALGQSGVVPLEVPTQRRKINLLPRTVFKSEGSQADATPAGPTMNSDDEESEAACPSMIQVEAEAQVDQNSKEFFSVRDLSKADVYFTKLPLDHRWRLIDKLAMSAIESKEADAQLVANLFERAALQDLCSPASFEQGLLRVAEILDDIVIFALKAFNLMATMMKGARLDQERNSRLASKSMDRDKLLSLLTPDVPQSRVESPPYSQPTFANAARVSPPQNEPNPPMSDTDAYAMVCDDVQELFSFLDLRSGTYFTRLPAHHHWRLVDKLVSGAIANKSDAQLVASLFDRVATRHLCSPASSEAGFAPVAHALEYIVIGAPRALDCMAIMMRGAHIHEDHELCERLGGRSRSGGNLLSLLAS